MARLDSPNPPSGPMRRPRGSTAGVASARLQHQVKSTAVPGMASVRPATGPATGPAMGAQGAPAAKTGARPGTPVAGKGAGPLAPSRAAPAAPRRSIFRVRLLPTMIVIAVLVLGMRVGEVWRLITTAPIIEAATAATSQAATAATSQAATAASQGKAPTAPSPAAGTPAAASAKAAANPAATDGSPDNAGDTNFGNIQIDLLKRLQAQRADLDRRTKQLDEREALLTTVEQRVDRKVAELKTLRANIEKLIGTVDEKQQEQLDSLVKIYEAMKPVDAARIFNTLDMPVLLNVIERMKESKTAPIMAAMDPTRAKDVTTQLADRSQLPTLPPQ